MKRSVLLVARAAIPFLALAAIVVLMYIAVTQPDVNVLVAAATAAATIVLATVGAATASQNARLLRASAEQAAASDRLATAAKAQADATLDLVEEARLDRQMEFQPVLTGKADGPRNDGDGPYVLVQVQNIGRGPALFPVIAYHHINERSSHSWGSRAFIDLAAQNADTFNVYLGGGPTHQSFRSLVDDLPAPALAIGYEDAFGNRYRWTIRAGARADTDMWRRGASPKPEWTQWRDGVVRAE